MSYLEVIFIFISFCFIHEAFDIAGKFASAKLMKKNIQEYVDTAVMSVFRSTLRVKAAGKAVPADPAEEGVENNG